MNKQEINEKLKENGTWCTEYHTGETDRYVKIRKAMELIGQLDEPQKPKTEVFNHDEKFVVEWLDHTTEYHYSLYNAINDAGSEVRSWMKIGFNSHRFARALMSLDYEVEKEPLYTVTINLDLKYHLVVDEGDGDDEIITTLTTTDGVFGYRYFLTENEIKSADENLWPFAVPVEEGVER